MAHRYAPPYPVPHRRSVGSVGRFLWPALVLGGFAALVAYLAASDGKPGMSDRSWLVVLLAAVVAGVLTFHRGQGARHLLWTLIEYAVVALLAVLLVTSGGHEPAPAKGRRHPDAHRGQEPNGPVLVQVPGHVAGWISDRWQAATEAADRQATPPSTTRPRR
jgi:lysylphosphatidylglycerol synthetase-like protein (DUF2156 family)